ncbi:MAG: hypothetical protein ACOX0T_07815 [Pelotomaculum sp.]|jgi:hypothetical protein
MSDALAEFLRQKKRMQDQQNEQHAADKEQWPAGVESFYRCLEDWLADMIEEKIIFLHYEVLHVNEHKQGAVYTRKLNLFVGGDEIEFIPSKRVSVGATGHIEMKTNNVSMDFIRDGEGIWRHLFSRTPLKADILTKQNFRELLLSVLS